MATKKQVGRLVGKLYRTIVPSVWFKYCMVDPHVPVVVQDEAGEFTKPAKMPIGLYVVYLGNLKKGACRVLWDEQICRIHNEWLSANYVKK